MTQFVQVYDTADNSCKKRALPRVIPGGGILVDKTVVPSTGAATYRVRIDPASIDAIVGPATNLTPGLVALAIPSEYPALIADNAQATTPAYVNTAVNAALAAYVPDSATSNSAGIVELATAADFPDATNDTDATTPAYVASAISSIPPVPAATNSVPGIVSLAVSANYPSTSNIEATTPSYVNVAINTAVAAAVAALPADIFLTSLASYDAVTNIMTLNMSDGSTVPVDLTALVTDAVNSVPLATNSVQGLVSLAVAANYPSTSNVEATTPAYVTSAINTAIGAIPVIADATDTTAGKVSLAVAANYPSTSNTEAATPAYVAAAIAAAEDDVSAVDLTISQNAANGNYQLKVDVTEGTTTVTSGTKVIPLWNQASTLGALTYTDVGVGKLVNHSNVLPIPQADTLTLGADVAPSVRSLDRVFSNRAADGGTAGMVNSDGSLGYFSRVPVNLSGTDAAITAGLAATVAANNGAMQRITFTNGQIITLPNPSYTGQRLNLKFSAANRFMEAIVTQSAGFNASVYRNSQHVIRPGSAASNNIIVRASESLNLVAISPTIWLVENHAYHLHEASQYREYSDGKADMFFTHTLAANIPVGGNVVEDSILPAAITNPTNIRTFFNDMDAGAWTLGIAGIPSSLQPLSYLNNKVQNTATTIRIGTFNLGTVAYSPANIDVLVKGAIFDYAALGGIASF